MNQFEIGQVVQGRYKLRKGGTVTVTGNIIKIWEKQVIVKLIEDAGVFRIGDEVAVPNECILGTPQQDRLPLDD